MTEEKIEQRTCTVERKYKCNQRHADCINYGPTGSATGKHESVFVYLCSIASEVSQQSAVISHTMPGGDVPGKLVPQMFPVQRSQICRHKLLLNAKWSSVHVKLFKKGKREFRKHIEALKYE